MKHTNNKLYIKNKYRTVYKNGNNYYYRCDNKYQKISNKQSKFIGGADEEDKEALQNSIKKFIKNKKILKNKILLFDDIVKFFKQAFDNDIINSIKKSLKFLTDYNNKINVLIDTFKHDEDGQLNSTQIRMMITNIKKFIFDKIFVNYFIDIISKYYIVNDMRREIKELMHMLTFVEDDRKDELLYKQKINILLDRLNEYNNKFTTNYSNKLSKFDEKYQLFKDGKNEDGEFDEEDEEDYDDISFDKFLKIKQGIIKDFKINLEQKEVKFIEMQQTIYWWDKLGSTLESEFRENHKLYKDSLKIFFKELIAETINKDLIMEQLKNNRQAIGDNKMDPELYNIYEGFLRNDFLQILDNEKKLTKEYINGNVSYEELKDLRKNKLTEQEIKKRLNLEDNVEINLGIRGRFKDQVDKYIKEEIDILQKQLDKTLDTKQRIIPGLLGSTGSLVGGGEEESASSQRDKLIKTKNRLEKFKKILIDKMIKYTDILLILAKENENNEELSETTDIVTIQSFKDMAKILILFLKQHILNFSTPFGKILNDIKRYHEIIMQEVDVCNKLLREAEIE